MLDFSCFSKDFEAVADRWAFERLLKTNRNFRFKRVARMIAARSAAEDNVFGGFGREMCTRLDDDVDNIFA